MTMDAQEEGNWLSRLATVFRVVVAIGSMTFAVAAFFESVGLGWWPGPQFDGWPTQVLRDFTVLMVSYALLCIVVQKNRPFIIDFIVFVASFCFWIFPFMYAIANPNDTGISEPVSLIAVLLAVLFSVCGPVFKGDTRFIFQKRTSPAPPLASA